MDPVSVGLLGCGTISDAYLSSDDRFDSFEFVACADVDPNVAAETAAEYDLEARTPAELREDPAIEAVVNLTPPAAHAETVERLLEAGNHVYVEKPIAATVDDADRIVDAAESSDLLVGSAPDTFLGAGLQTCRSVIDSGRIGEPIGATAIWTSGGHESWHPNPDFYYHEGGGPLFDMGPYYVTALVSLLGPVERVTGSVSRAFDERTITSEPRASETIDVEVPTHESGVLEFADGTIANLTTSFDVPGGSTLPSPAFEIYGTDGTLALPDPNHFEGPVRVSDHDTDGFEEVELTHEYTDGRGAGVADLAMAIRGDWEHRTGAGLANHVLSVLSGVRAASERAEHVAISDADVGRPEPLPASFPDGNRIE
ncbi:oxidoreductase domain protein [Salinarchaeum sp. Harcht-Bsk1]|uniref:Gfo/Idh/MocA family protein n=1 Tax=Salinarchaeum sp. Harcht-Bsk1 TaxID=1333523 RepID=UPI00034235D0|nr:Gfo/Idh/MocA family oxidoreductase [Salinarchaeum sp. Harcht-Bsk1]AGN00087.1 oxidoreductase domain protein [Salinarchaeum sp. Harcht-Bsk1]